MKKNTSRKKAREVVLKALYLAESRGIGFDEALDELLAIEDRAEKLEDGPESRDLQPFAPGLSDVSLDYARRLGRAVEAKRGELDAMIVPLLRNWDLARVARIDRIIMWISLTEMSVFLDVPVAVSINEAVELAKKYSTEKGPAFVNGILDRAAESFRNQ